MTGTDNSDSLVDRWLIREWAYSTTVIGIRGDSAQKAVNKIDDGDRVVHLQVGKRDREEFDQIERDEVPEWARERIERKHEKRIHAIETAIGD